MIIYLSAPYSHINPKVRDSRFRRINRKAAELMIAGHTVFSPISHSHPIAEQEKLPSDHSFWMAQDLPFVNFCDALYVYRLAGWQWSNGVKAEITTATNLNKHIEYID